MEIPDPLPDYRAYLLRFWAEDPAHDGQVTVRFSLESPRNPQPYGFANLETLVAFLRSEMKQFEANHASPAEQDGFRPPQD